MVDPKIAVMIPGICISLVMLPAPKNAQAVKPKQKRTATVMKKIWNPLSDMAD